MRVPIRTFGAGALVVAVTLGGCRGGTDPADDATDASGAVDEDAPDDGATAQDDGDGSDQDADGSGDEAASDPDDEAASDPDDEPEAGGTVEVDETIEHASRVTVTVTSVEVEDRAVYVTLEATNDGAQDVELAFEPDFVTLVDDEDRDYPWSPPDEDAELPLPSGAALDARLGFLGAVPDSATSLSLRLNYNAMLDSGLESFPETTETPTFVFDGLPIPGR